MDNHGLAINRKYFYEPAACRAAIALGVLIFLVSSAGQAANGFVPVNQFGYELGAESRAYLMANGSENGATFEVISSGGKTVCSKAIGIQLSQWGKLTVYSLDFRVDLAGTSISSHKRPASPQRLNQDLIRFLEDSATDESFCEHPRDLGPNCPVPRHPSLIVPGHPYSFAL